MRERERGLNRHDVVTGVSSTWSLPDEGRPAVSYCSSLLSRSKLQIVARDGDAEVEGQHKNWRRAGAQKLENLTGVIISPNVNRVAKVAQVSFQVH